MLLVGAVNVTNLMLVRSSARMKELATRHALGAGLARIARQLLTETMLLSVAGGALGLALGYAGVRALAAFGLEATPQGTQVSIDATVIAFTIGLAFALALLIGLVPVLSLRQMNLSQSFREEGRSGTASRGARVTRRVLVTAQVAFAFMLLIGAGLLLASFQRVLAVRPGFDASHVMTGIVSPPATRYKEDAQLIAFWNQLTDRVRALPGVQAAGITGNIPLGGDYSDSVILAEGYAMAPGESLISPYQVVGLARLLRGDVDPAQARTVVHRVRRRAGAEGADHRRAPGAAVLEGRGSGGTPDVEAGRARGPGQGARSQDQLLHRRRRRRQRQDDGADREGAGRRLLLPVRAERRARDDAGDAHRGRSVVDRRRRSGRWSRRWIRSCRSSPSSRCSSAWTNRS